ncbi:serine hydrolase [Flavobacterium sp. MAH-1]|uniref:Serine hydrolase n=1 Tax=Flavobacterium agri TaxID=2743471 RepID=A0A7Y8XZ90_9FLAO|nr:serine hydrolase [Flavobacterium agri]NYA69456.1 serine hydrolase [Flavobacterium agri]
MLKILPKSFAFFLLAIQYAAAQMPDLVKTDGIRNKIHQDNVGRIVFMARNIPIDSLSQKDFLKEYTLTKKSNLNIRVFLANSIINYQHNLAPSLSEEQLRTSGNYQFRFFVDDRLIYSENIHYGCGLKKSTTTTFRVPLTDTSGADFWSIYLFDRFKDNGGRQALTDGTHRFRIEMRPYLNIENASTPIVGDLIAKGELDLIIQTPPLPKNLIDVQKIKPSADFEIAASDCDTQKIKELNRQIALENFRQITSIVVVVKNGKLLLEEYFNGADRNTLHDTRSVGKSFTSAFMGMAISDGFIKNENQVLGDFYELRKFANYSDEKAKITLKDLLTMSSIFDGSDQNSESPGNEENMYPTDNWMKFALDLPIDPKKQKQKHWDYFTAGVVLLGDILDKSVADGLEKYADKKLFKPMGITDYKWEYTPQKVVNTAGGLRMNSLDLAKIGQLYQNGGLWKGKRILPKKWVDASLSSQLPIPDRDHEFYGYLFWNKTYKVGDKTYDVFYCAGNGGNKIFIFKDLPLTVVVTATAFNRPYAHPQVDTIMQEYVLPAVLKN